MVKLEAGQWWADPEQAEHRRFKITKVEKKLVHYADCYGADGQIYKRVSSRIGWEVDVESGRLVPSTTPTWGMR